MTPEQLKFNIYEIQVILYWILGVLIINIGEWHWVGWIAIGYGWFCQIITISLIVEYVKN